MRILVLFGGESVEHEISVITANQIINALKINYTVIPIYISKDNRLYHMDGLDDLACYKKPNLITKKRNEVMISRKGKMYFIKGKGLRKKKYFDIAFPVVHGKGMEDGTLLSYLKFNKIPVVADSISFYPLAQNKILTKRILNDLKIKNVSFSELDKYFENEIKIDKFPVIVKPNALGSSIGVKKANNEEELKRAVDTAFEYDKKVIIEQYIENNREYNISVLKKNNEILVSDIEEIVKDDGILSYSQKYERNGSKGMVSAKRIFPAKIDKSLKENIEKIAKKIYKHFEAKGVIRIDFLYNGELYVNEINSIPGSYSYYLWKEKMDFVELLDTVIESSKREIYLENKLIKSIDKMNIFSDFKGQTSKLK